MAKFQSMLPLPVPVESCSTVVTACARSACVAAGTALDVDASVTATVWVSPVSASVKFSVPAGAVGVVSGAAEPVSLPGVWCAARNV
jgi:hypothetical protein